MSLTLRKIVENLKINEDYQRSENMSYSKRMKNFWSIVVYRKERPKTVIYFQLFRNVLQREAT